MHEEELAKKKKALGPTGAHKMTAVQHGGFENAHVKDLKPTSLKPHFDE